MSEVLGVLFSGSGVIVVLALGRRFVPATAAWLKRRRHHVSRPLGVVIVVDRNRSWLRRRSFWMKALQRGRLGWLVQVRTLSISDELSRNRNPARKLLTRTDVVILNWDVINGDPAYGADRAQSFLRHYRPDLLEWIRAGGLLLVEAQGAAWHATQEPYDCVTTMFRDSHARVCSVEHFGNEVTVENKHKNHPVVKGLTDADLKLPQGGSWQTKSWFPKRLGYTYLGGIQHVTWQHLYRGWFDEWSDDWTPLLVTRLQPPKPVMLARTVKPPAGSADQGGMCVITTMYIASSALHRLVTNLVELPGYVHVGRDG